jgi:hypothetical protein
MELVDLLAQKTGQEPEVITSLMEEDSDKDLLFSTVAENHEFSPQEICGLTPLMGFKILVYTHSKDSGIDLAEKTYMAKSLEKHYVSVRNTKSSIDFSEGVNPEAIACIELILAGFFKKRLEKNCKIYLPRQYYIDEAKRNFKQAGFGEVAGNVDKWIEIFETIKQVLKPAEKGVKEVGRKPKSKKEKNK